MLKTNTIRKSKQIRSSSFFERIFIEQKLDNTAGYILFALVAAVFGYLIATQMLVGIEIFVAVVGLFLAIACMVSTEFGLYLNMFFAFFAFYFNRLLFHDDFQVGIVSDLLVLTTFLGLFFGSSDLKKNFKPVTNSPIVMALLIYTFFLLIELFNPYAHSFDGWFQTFRRFLVCILVLYIAYQVLKDYAAIKRFLTVLFILAVVAGLYGCIQQWHGLFNFELELLYSKAKNGQVFYINGGDIRKFSTMSDPLSYAVAMAGCSLFFLILATYIRKFWHRFILIVGSIIMLLGMAYSGTRTANVMVIAGLAMFILLTLNKRSTQIFAVAAVLIFLFLLYVPIYSNGPLNRFRTSFIGKEDASFNVREVNRKMIQPYIYSHAIGGGLCTSGEPGLRYNPGHQLAGFPPDSSYLRKALETGWIGLAFIMVIYYITLRYAIRGFFVTRNDGRKILYAACIATIFAFYIAEFPQEALGQISDMMFYYPILAIIIRLRNMEKKKDTELAI